MIFIDSLKKVSLIAFDLRRKIEILGTASRDFYMPGRKMSSGVSASVCPPTFSSSPSVSQTTHHYDACNSFFSRALSSSNLKTRGLRFSAAKEPHIIRIRCNSSTRPGGSGSGTIIPFAASILYFWKK